MGDPKRRRKKYSKPAHPWQRERIEEERILVDEYGVKNKKEIWKADSLLKNFKRQAKRLVTLSTAQAETEKKLLITRLNSMGLLKSGTNLEDVLGINLKDVLERRLQTIVFRKKLAHSVKQARQFIVHRHIAVGDNVINVPSYIVLTDEENKISFRASSGLAREDHPERIIAAQEKPAAPKKQRKVEDKRGKKKMPYKKSKKE